MGKNAREKEFFEDWAKNVQKSDCLLWDSNVDSYFIKRNQNENYIWEYDVESVPELRDLLDEQWEGNKELEKILTAVLVAAIKNKPQIGETVNEDITKQVRDRDMEELPMYIYNF